MPCSNWPLIMKHLLRYVIFTEGGGGGGGGEQLFWICLSARVFSCDLVTSLNLD